MTATITVRSPSARFLLVTALGGAALGFNFGSSALLTNDDTRFPMLAHDILANGRWLLPALPDGTPHLAKPPLMAWLIALASWPAGAVSVASAVLPSLLSAIGVVILTYVIARRLFDVDAAAVASLTGATTIGMYFSAHSAMPDMVQLLGLTAAMAAYVAAELGQRRRWLVAFYAFVGVASLAKGAAGFLPLAIVLVYSLVRHGVTGPRRLVSLPGLVVLGMIAVPWWVVAARSGGHDGFVSAIVFDDQLLWYFGGGAWRSRTLTEPVIHAVAVTLPWCVLLPFAIYRAARERHADLVPRVRLLLVWLATVFVVMAAAGQQRERYYLPLCPAVALLIGWWYTTLAWRRRALAFAAAWVAVVAVGVALVPGHTREVNTAMDVGVVREVVARAPAPLYAADVPELALSFNVGRPVLLDRDVSSFQARVRRGDPAYLIVSDRLLRRLSGTSCLRPVASGATLRPFTMLAPVGCERAAEIEHDDRATTVARVGPRRP